MKVKEYLLPYQQYLQEQEFWSGYEAYLDRNDQSPTAIELDQMQAEYPHAKRETSIITQAVNNLDYNDPQGA